MDKLLRYRFQRTQRLIQKQSFSQATKFGDRWSTGPWLIYLKQNGLGFARLGMAIGKRHAKTAVLRNNIKRLIRDGFRHQQHALAACDVVFILRTNINEDVDLHQTIQQLWHSLIKRSSRYYADSSASTR